MPRVILIGLLLAAMASLANAQPAAEEPLLPATVDIERIRELIRYLNDPVFSKREAAASELLKLGDAARPELEAAARLPQPEIRLQVRRILARLRQGDFERALEALLADTSGSADHKLPLWPQFRERVGFDLAAREAYVAMLRAEPALMNEIDQRPRTSGSYVYNRCQELRKQSNDEGREVPGPHIAALLFVAADERVPISSSANSQISSFCHHSGVKSKLDAKDEPSVMKTLVSQWIAGGRGGNYALRLAMTYDLPAGLVAAEKMIAGDEAAYYKQYAALAIAKLGNESHLPLLAPLMEDASVCATHRINDTTYQAQLRDIALVATIHLHGKNPKAFGFDRIRPSTQYLYSSYSLGFENDEARLAAFAKWEEAAATAKDED